LFPIKIRLGGVKAESMLLRFARNVFSRYGFKTGGQNGARRKSVGVEAQ